MSSAEFAQRVEMVNLYNVTVSLDVKLIDTDMEYRNNAKFWDRQAQDNSVGLDQWMLDLIRVYTVYYSF